MIFGQVGLENLEGEFDIGCGELMKILMICCVKFGGVKLNKVH